MNNIFLFDFLFLALIFIFYYMIHNFKTEDSMVLKLYKYAVKFFLWLYIAFMFVFGVPAILLTDPADGLLIIHYSLFSVFGVVMVVFGSLIGWRKFREVSGIKKIWEDFKRSL